IDPIIPPIALDLAVAPETVALLSTAFSLPFALIQPILGPLADAFGKTRIMTICLLILIGTAGIGATATSFSVARVTGARRRRGRRGIPGLPRDRRRPRSGSGTASRTRPISG